MAAASDMGFDAVIVGAGLMGRWHAAAAARTARVSAVVDPDLHRARALAALYRGCLAKQTIDDDVLVPGRVVHICTPTQTHELLAAQAIEANCHVLIEKPLATSLPATEDLLGAAAARGLLACPVHQFVFQRGVVRLTRALPKLGEIRHLDFMTCSAGAAHVGAEGRDRVATEILAHPFSLFARILGDRFRELEWVVARGAPGEIRATGQDGVRTAGILISMAGRPPVIALRMIAEKGTVHADLFHGFAVFENAAISGVRKGVRPFVVSSATLCNAAANVVRRIGSWERAYPGLRELVHQFYGAAAGLEPNPLPRAEVLAVAAAIDRVANSSACR